VFPRQEFSLSRILDRIDSPADLHALSLDELKSLAQEIRDELVATTAQTGGHLASNLGVVELTLALHRVFDSPRDKIVWDVSHQVYVQKLITGRRGRFDTIRTLGGLSGFADRTESEHDQFGAGHAGTAISAALGMAAARQRTGEQYDVVAVLGDGALTAGMAMEAHNHAGGLKAGMLVVLNDNGMSISPNVGALAQTINRVRMDPLYQGVNRMGERLLDAIPAGHRLVKLAAQLKSRARATLYQPAWFFEHFGFEYFGPVDGNDLEEMLLALDGIKDYLDRPVLLHVLTQKGHGYAPAEADPIKLHGVSPAGSKKAAAPTYSQVFADTCGKLIEQDNRVVAITAAMLEGTALVSTARKHPDRVYDVGICEQHGVTFAAGLATQGVRPICGIYSTFLQRGYDQVVHDVALQNLPVVLAMDRAGFVGDDGKTHQGAFDIAYLRCLPNMVLAAPKDENELQHLLYTGTRHDGPFAVRFPRGAGYGVPMDTEFHELPVGKGELLREGEDVAILAYGAPVMAAVAAAERLADSGIQCAVVNARYAKPLDDELLLDVCSKARAVLTLEEHVLAGGFGEAVITLLTERGPRDLPVLTRTMPDEYVDHGPQAHFRHVYGLDADGIVAAVRELIDGRPAPDRETVKQIVQARLQG
jgi:1-deoxy-D-xylulose-5-phosphate synthase